MAKQNLESKLVMLAGSAFALGVIVGMALQGAAKQGLRRARVAQWRRGVEQTDTYDENLPDQLGRREPSPAAGQPRFGGTGAIGVHPATVEETR